MSKVDVKDRWKEDSITEPRAKNLSGSVALAAQYRATTSGQQNPDGSYDVTLQLFYGKLFLSLINPFGRL